MNLPIIDAVDAALIEAELTPGRFLRNTNKGHNSLYIVDAHSCPNTMREIGRLREIAFRGAGGGTGKDCDIDEFDTMPAPCHQLIVWDPENKLILGGYRIIRGAEMEFDNEGKPRIATAHMFSFSRKFLEEFLPATIELGRSFVRTEYQSSREGIKSIYVLDNLWDGLGALTVLYPEIKYLFGKVTMYPSYNEECRNMILHFLHKHFPDRDGLVRPIEPLQVPEADRAMEEMFHADDFKADYRILNAAVQSHGYHIPPLVNAYMSLSPTMRMFGTAVNSSFGNVEESGIFLAIDEILQEKKDRHINTFHP